jgi:hypothetical protein
VDRQQHDDRAGQRDEQRIDLYCPARRLPPPISGLITRPVTSAPAIPIRMLRIRTDAVSARVMIAASQPSMLPTTIRKISPLTLFRP